MNDLISLSETEVEEALNVGNDFKVRMAAAFEATQAAMAETADHVLRGAVSTECLLLAAFMYGGDFTSFILCATQAFNTAREAEGS
jgi:hypothetical protein